MLYLVLPLSEYHEYAGLPYTSIDDEGKIITNEPKSAIFTADQIYKKSFISVALGVDAEINDFNLTGRALYSKEAIDSMFALDAETMKKTTKKFSDDSLKRFPFTFPLRERSKENAKIDELWDQE